MRVSVCLPTYNGEAFVAEAVRSVLAQRWQDFELLVIDDQSTDATLDVVRSFADPRLQVCQNPQRLGIPGNWNRCLELAQGEYVGLFHQDDVMLPGNLERKVQILASDPTISLVHSAAKLIVDDSAPAVPSDWMEDASEDFILEGERYFRKLLFRGNLICASTVIALRKKLLDLGGFDKELGFACDYEMWMKMCVENRVAFLSQPLVGYRWHENNASHAYRFERGVEECLVASRRALQYYQKRTRCQIEAEIVADALVPLAELRRWATELERGKAWLEEQSQNWQRVAEQRECMLQENRAWISKLERGKAWLEEQSQNWQRVAEQREKVVQEQKAWIGQLEQGKAWLEAQRENWQRVAEQQEKVVQEQKAWIGQLEQGKAWLEGQVENWQMKVGQLQGTIEQLQSTIEQLRHQWIPQSLRQIVKNLAGGKEIKQ